MNKEMVVKNINVIVNDMEANKDFMQKSNCKIN